MRTPILVTLAIATCLYSSACSRSPTPHELHPEQQVEPEDRTEPGLYACATDQDCVIRDSCLGCNKCSSRPFVAARAVDCEARCHPDPTLSCRCEQGRCETRRQQAETRPSQDQGGGSSLRAQAGLRLDPTSVVAGARHELEVSPAPDPRSTRDLARAYLEAVKASDDGAARQELALLDQALASGPPYPQSRSRYGFPGEVGLGALALGGHLLAAGGESGSLSVYFLRNGHRVDLGKLSTPARYLRNRPAVVGTVAYVGLQDGGLLKIDLLTGEQLWQAGVGSVRYSDPLARGRSVYVVGKDGLYALVAATGEVRWHRRYTGADNYYGDATVRWRTGELVVVARARGRYLEHRFEPARGQILGTRHLANYSERGPVPVDGPFPVRPRVKWQDLVCRLTEGPRWNNCNGPHLVCRRGGKVAFDVPADTWDCVTSDYEQPTLVGPLLFTGSSAIDLSFREQ